MLDHFVLKRLQKSFEEVRSFNEVSIEITRGDTLLPKQKVIIIPTSKLPTVRVGTFNTIECDATVMGPVTLDMEANDRFIVGEKVYQVISMQVERLVQTVGYLKCLV